MDCVVQMHQHSKGAVLCPDPELICHHVDAELVESYRLLRFHRGAEPETGLYLEEGGLCWVQLSVALHLRWRIKAFYSGLSAVFQPEAIANTR